jgi:two-component system cell cycle response regulator
MKPHSRWSTNELIPLADRWRYMFVVRAFLIGTIVLTAAVAPGLVGALPDHVYAILGAWAGASLAAETVRRLWHRRALPLFGATLILDGLALVWLSEVGSVTNVRYLIFPYMVAIVLLASYRTGLKMALWFALLSSTVFFAPHNGAFAMPHVEAGTVAKWDLGQLSVFVVALWLATIASASFSAVNERELRRRRFDLEALARFAVSLESASDRQTVAAVLLDSLADAFPLGRMLLTTAGRHPVVLSMRGLVPESTNPPQLELSSALLRVQSTHQTLLLSGFDRESDPWLNAVMVDAGNFVVVPLHAEGGCVGVLVAEHSARNSSRVERRLVTIIERFASQTALALRNAALLEEMEQMATTDGLTHIANRRAFQETFEREVARSIRSGEPISLLMIDIDNFKVLNDTYGHQVGDEVLRQVAAAIQAGSRDIDTAARYGGEEFAVILPGCGSRDALVSAERLRRFVNDSFVGRAVTVSAGAATFPDQASTAEALVKAADNAMYRAKRAGRNRVRVAEFQNESLVKAANLPLGPNGGTDQSYDGSWPP